MNNDNDDREYVSSFINSRENFTRDDLRKIVDFIHGRYLADTIMSCWNFLELSEKNRELHTEHEKSIALLMENEAQKIELEVLNDKLKESLNFIEKISRQDSLTGLLNRRHFLEIFEVEFLRAKRVADRMARVLNESKKLKSAAVTEEENRFLKDNFGKLVCAMIDVDFFKDINDKYGHLCGDHVLEQIGKLLMDNSIFRSSDAVARYGGDEFMLLLPDTNSVNALIPLRKFLGRLEETDFRLEGECGLKVTVSIGISEYYETDNTINEIINRADKALYKVKNQGRNGVSIFGE